MKLCDKLPKLRKENNMSQEMLADKLEMSRQAISKWESGSSYPDMNTIMKLCKILNCSLSDIVDDDACEKEKYKEYKINLNEIYKEVIEFITKSYNMFTAMTFKQIIKCILEMFILFILLFAALMITGEVFSNIIFSIIKLLPETIAYFIHSILIFLYQIAAISFGSIVFIHLFKIRYLDYYITVKDEEVEEKKIEKSIVKEDSKKIIIRDPKHSSYNFLKLIGNGIFFCFQILTSIFSIPFIISFVFLSFIFFVFLFYSMSGLIFVGLTISILGIGLLNYFCLEILYNIIFKQLFKFRKLFLIIMTGLVLAGCGAGISFVSFMSFDEVTPSLENTTYIDFEMEDDIVLVNLLRNYNDNIIVIDNNIKNVQLSIKHLDFSEYKLEEYEHKNFSVLSVEQIENPFKIGNEIINTIKRKEIPRYDLSEEGIIEIKLSQDNYNKLSENTTRYYEGE